MHCESSLPPAALLSLPPLCAASFVLCSRCGAELPPGGRCIDCEDDADVAGEPVPQALEALVRQGSRWTTRGLLSRAVIVVQVLPPQGLALVQDERTGEQWCERITEITRAWSRRISTGRFAAVRGGR